MPPCLQVQVKNMWVSETRRKMLRQIMTKLDSELSKGGVEGSLVLGIFFFRIPEKYVCQKLDNQRIFDQN